MIHINKDDCTLYQKCLNENANSKDELFTNVSYEKCDNFLGLCKEQTKFTDVTKN